MKKLVLISVLLLTGFIYAGEGIVLYPELSYRTDNEEFKYVDKHYFGDKVELTGEVKKAGKNQYNYKVITVDGENYLSSSFFIIDNAVQGTVVKTAYLYSQNDLSSPTSNKVNPMLFVAVDKDTLDGELVKVSYYLKDDIKTAWIKKSAISMDKDNCGASIKYFLATIQESLEDREERLSLILKRHKSSVFIPLVKKMIEEDHLRVTENEIEIDPDFAGSNEELKKSYNVVIYKEPDVISEVLFTGETKIILNKRSISPVAFNGVTAYMYHVTSSEASGWIHGLE